MQAIRVILTAGLCALVVACSKDEAPPAPATTTAPSEPAVTEIAPVEPAPAAPGDVAPAAAVPAEEPAPAAAPAEPAEPAEPAPAPAAEAAPAAPAAAAPSGDEPSYTVTCEAGATVAEKCTVDKATYVGWRTFAGQCQVCHGGSALGSTFAPNLLDRFHQRVDYPRFVDVVLNGYHGQVGVMPGWKGNPNVEPHIDAIYQYLKARADDVLPPGRPARAP